MGYLYKEGNIIVYRHDIKGLCVFAGRDIKAKEHIVTCPVALMDFDDIKKSSNLDMYPMYWSKKKDCICFGVINLLNHSQTPSVYLKRDYKKKLIKCYAKRDLSTGEELTISFQCPIWFKEDIEDLYIN